MTIEHYEAVGIPVLDKTAPPYPLSEWMEPKGLEEARSAIVSLGRSMHENAYSLGRYLSWVKRQVGHGHFVPWFDTHVTLFTIRTAQRAMGFAQQCDEAGTLLDYSPRKYDTASFLPAPSLPGGTFRILYADPPWAYRDSRTDLPTYGPAIHHYPTMSIEELCALPVKGLAAENAVLFIWVTSPLLEECFEVIKAWGFIYKASFVWDKVKHNFGHYNSVRHEFLLVCTRESCTPDVSTLYDSVQVIERSATHSAKPDAFRTIIDALYPHGARIELFSRSAHPGWKTWGNEVSPEACEPVQTGCTTKENIQ